MILGWVWGKSASNFQTKTMSKLEKLVPLKGCFALLPEPTVLLDP